MDETQPVGAIILLLIIFPGYEIHYVISVVPLARVK